METKIKLLPYQQPFPKDIIAKKNGIFRKILKYQESLFGEITEVYLQMNKIKRWYNVKKNNIEIFSKEEN